MALRVGNKIIGIGRNYSEHAKELGNAVPSLPIIFLKPTSSLLYQPNPILVPNNTIVHHEIELGVLIGRDGSDIKASCAMDFVSGYCVALDLTARNIQDEAKKNGNPWTIAKGYDTFTPISDFIPANDISISDSLKLQLSIDGKMRQNGSTKDMIFKIPYLIQYISHIMKLEKGDLILTGTPAGVGPITAGNILHGKLLSADEKILTEFKFKCENRMIKN